MIEGSLRKMDGGAKEYGDKMMRTSNNPIKCCYFKIAEIRTQWKQLEPQGRKMKRVLFMRTNYINKPKNE